MFKYSVFSCVLGFILDMVLGDPQWNYHPVRLIGRLIEACESVLRKMLPDTEKGLKAAGFFLVVIVCTVTMAVTAAVNMFFYGINTYLGIMTEGIICYFMISAKSLKTESMKVYDELLKGNLENSRRAVSMIVGRDTQDLDKKGVIKAAVETVAENLSDGITAPVLYILMGGSVLGAFYKAVNTMDSMVGYKNDRYMFFGRCAARLDDVLNFIPSRLSAVMLIVSAFICGRDYKNAVKIFRRDRLKHASPNSAQTEAACAGALRIQLAGDAYYFGKLYKKPFIGDALEEVSVQNIADINKMMYCSAILTVIIFGGIRLLFFLGADII